MFGNKVIAALAFTFTANALYISTDLELGCTACASDIDCLFCGDYTDTWLCK